jgi:sugar phosphate isomerase/epimerase
MKLASCSSVYCNYSLQYAIQDLSNIGYDGIEIWADRPHMFRDDLDVQINQIRALLQNTGMQVCSFLPSTSSWVRSIINPCSTI